ncbi:MAG: hypothetical protein AB7H88_18590 [Vicinamibacterales bacterium]
MTRRLAAALALAVALAHLPFLAASLEDIDSANFALGLRQFDVAEHRPHPPGYPVYIALGKLSKAVVSRVGSLSPESAVDARALALLSLLGGALAVWLVYRLYACAGPGPEGERTGVPWARLDARALAVALVAGACPLAWYLTARPMSDMPGLAAELAAQAALALAWWRQQPRQDGERRLAPDELAASGRMIVLGALLAALAIGMRSQAFWLTAPLLLLVLVDRLGRGAAGALLGAFMTFTIGGLAWGIPLLVLSGGPAAYLAALGGQAGDDFAGVEMLYLHPSARLLARGLVDTFVVPWDSYWLGGIVVALAAVGAMRLAATNRRALALVAGLALPYLAFHLLFQEPAVVRYALPLVPPTVFLAAAGLDLLERRAALAGAGALAVAALATGVPTLAAYASAPSPVRQAVAAMEAAGQEAPVAVGAHFVYRRPLEAEPALPARQLPSPAGREWLELVDLWRSGATGPVWFLADPVRTDLALVDPASRQDRRAFRWGLESLCQLGGIRPYGVDWYVLRAPGWFAGAGWALTPETGGVARVMGRGPSIGPIPAWVRRRPEPVHVLVGGRNLADAGSAAARFSLAIDGREAASWTADPGFFLQVLELPAGALEGDGPLAELTIASTAVSGDVAVPTAIEQFDLQTVGTTMWGYAEGWHEAEYSTRLGPWRWTSERAVLRVVDATGPMRLTLRLEPPARSFDRPSTVTVRAGATVLSSSTPDGSAPWTIDVPLEALASAGGRVTIETDQVFVPADRAGGNDRRRLGLRVFSVDFAPFHTALR